MGNCHSLDDNSGVDDGKPVALASPPLALTNNEPISSYRIVDEIGESAIPGGLLPAEDWGNIRGPLQFYGLYSAAEVVVYLSMNGGVTQEGLNRMGIKKPGTCQRMLTGLLLKTRNPKHIVAQLLATHEGTIEKLEAELIETIRSGSGWACEDALQAHVNEKLLELRSDFCKQYSHSYKGVLTKEELNAALDDSVNAARLKQAISRENQLKRVVQERDTLLEWVHAQARSDSRSAGPFAGETGAFAGASAPSISILPVSSEVLLTLEALDLKPHPPKNGRSAARSCTRPLR
jgi:hypothetical protein